MRSEDRFLVELAHRLHDQFVEQGHVLFFADLLNDVAKTTNTAEHEALHVIGKLEDAFLIVRNGGHWDGRALARTAVAAGIIPANYQELFGFANSIRSPRSHGGGGGATPIPIGPAESLLLANHARTLLVYLGHRPRVAATTMPVVT